MCLFRDPGPPARGRPGGAYVCKLPTRPGKAQPPGRNEEEACARGAMEPNRQPERQYSTQQTHFSRRSVWSPRIARRRLKRLIRQTPLGAITMHKILAVLIGISAFLGTLGLAVAADPPVTRDELQKTFNAGNFKDAYEGLRRLALDPQDDPRLVGDDLKLAVQALRNLGRVAEIDDFREDVIKVHEKNWRLLGAAAESIFTTENHGYIVAGKFYRGNHRGGGKLVNSFERDRIRALQLMVQAKTWPSKTTRRTRSPNSSSPSPRCSWAIAALPRPGGCSISAIWRNCPTMRTAGTTATGRRRTGRRRRQAGLLSRCPRASTRPKTTASVGGGV